MNTEPWARCVSCSLQDLPCSFAAGHQQATADALERVLELERSLEVSQADIAKFMVTHGAGVEKFETTLQVGVARIAASLDIKHAVVTASLQQLNSSMQQLSGMVRQLQDELAATTSRTKETHAHVLQFCLSQDDG